MLALAGPPLPEARALVAGRWEAGARRFPVRNPATGALPAEVADRGAPATARAIASAPRHPAPVARPRPAAANDLAALLTAEQGRPLPEASAEIRCRASCIEWFCADLGPPLPTAAEGCKHPA